MGSKTKKFSINLPIDVYDKVSKIASETDSTLTSTIRQVITQWVILGDRQHPEGSKDSEDPQLIKQLQEHNRTLENLLESAHKALDQEQQLHAVSQKTIESQRLQLDESQRPKPLIARLKAIFMTD